MQFLIGLRECVKNTKNYFEQINIIEMVLLQIIPEVGKIANVENRDVKKLYKYLV